MSNRINREIKINDEIIKSCFSSIDNLLLDLLETKKFLENNFKNENRTKTIKKIILKKFML